MPRGLRVAAARVSGGRAARVGGGGETPGSAAPGIGCGTRRRHRNLDAADTHAHEGADLEQLETDGAAGRFRERRVLQPDAARELLISTQQNQTNGVLVAV